MIAKKRTVRQILAKSVISNLSYAQIFLVFVAFGLMVFFSFWYVGEAESKHLHREASNALASAQAKIETDLKEARTMLGSISQTLRIMILKGDDDSTKIHGYLNEMSKYVISSKENMEGFDGFYGYFETEKLNGVNIHNDDIEIQEGFDATKRPWYEAAVKANGKIAVASPYESVGTGNRVITYSQQIFDNDGNSLGVIGLDVRIDRISKYVIEVPLYKGSYGILTDENYYVLVHPHPLYLGKSLRQMNDGEAIIEELRGGDVFGRPVIDYENVPATAFIKRFDNGWYMGIITYADEFYKSIRVMRNRLILLGAIFALGLSFILVRIISARINADERTQLMLDSTPLGINIWNRKFQNIETNEEAIRMFGLSSKGEYLDRYYELSPKCQPDGTASSKKIIEIVRQAFDDGSCRLEWNYQKLNGEMLPCEITLIRVKHKDDFIVLSYMRDLRDIKASLAKMREAEERMQIMFNSMPLCANFRIRNKGIIDCNEEGLHLFGFASKQEYIKNYSKIYPEYQPDGRLSSEKAEELISKGFEEGYMRFEWTYQALNGDAIPSEVTFVRVKYRNDFVLATYIRDLREFKAMIREMRKAEFAEASNRAKSKFLAVMSHEIRTPMNTILGVTEIQLQDETLPHHIKEAFHEIYNSGDLLLGIINDILDLSKIEANKMELSIAKYEVANVINDTVHLNIMRNSKPIEINIDVAEDTYKYLLGDELRVKQILNNLLSNAFKYTDKGFIKLSACTEKEENEKAMLIIEVSDTGRGLTKEQVEKIFEEYTRFNTEANRSIEGVGLGMNITQRLINMMGGKISVESEVGKGSTFTVYIPQGIVDSQALGKELSENLRKFRVSNMSQLKKSQILREPMPYGSVLIVDDIASNLYVAKGLMLPYSLNIETVSSGDKAIEKVKQGNIYDIIFMDHMMPLMDGIEATNILREFGYTHPIVALTANAVVGQAEMFLKKGFDAFISKPIDIRQLNSVLNKYIRDKQPAEVIQKARKHSFSAHRGTASETDSSMQEVFLLDAKKSLPIIESTLKNVDDATDEDLHLFAINAHGLKSALANIDESLASQRAFILETAAREKNRNTIKTQAKLLIDEIQRIVERFESEKSISEADVKEDTGFLQEQLQIICKACADYDERPVISSLEALKKRAWKKETRTVIDKISEYILFSAFDEAGSIAAEHLKV